MPTELRSPQIRIVIIWQRVETRSKASAATERWPADPLSPLRSFIPLAVFLACSTAPYRLNLTQDLLLPYAILVDATNQKNV